MIYVRKPTEAECEELQRMIRQAVGRVSQRAHLILLSAAGYTVPALADLFGLSRASVRFWLHRFDVDGPSGLYDAPRSGRPRKVDDAVTATLDQLIGEDPAHAGYLATLWTVAMLVAVLLQTLGVHLSAPSVRQTLHRLDLRWGRPRLAMPRKIDPQKAQKQWQIVKTVVDAGPQAAILYADESRIELLPILRAMWHWVGHQVRIPTPGTNDTRAVFGALNIRTGRWVYQIRHRMFKEDFIAFLTFLLQQYPRGPIVLIVDNFSSHTAHAVTDWLADHPRLQLCYLPLYCSQLNPVERIWLRMKNKIAADRLYASMRILLETVDGFFAKMTRAQALLWAA